MAAVSAESVQEVEPEKDMCVEFFHHANMYYAVLSSDASCVQALHADPSERSASEKQWFCQAEVQAAAAKALLAAAERQMPTAPYDSGQVGPGDLTPFSAEEVQHMEKLIQALPSAAANQVTALVSGRKRARSHPSKGLSDAEAVPRMRLRPSAVRGASKRVEPARRLGRDDAVPSNTVIAAPRSLAECDTSPQDTSPLSAEVRAPFRTVAPARSSVLSVLRSVVFENPERFVLCPNLKFIDVVGALTVSSIAVETRFPLPTLFKSGEDVENLSEGTRRLLLVALESANPYSHEVGWMEPFSLDGVKYAMKISVAHPEWISVPCNWKVPARITADAVKTAVPLDITSFVEDALRREGRGRSRMNRAGGPFGGEFDAQSCDRGGIDLAVSFSSKGNAEASADLLLWNGLLVCILADEIALSQVEKSIVSYYSPPNCEWDCGKKTVGATFPTLIRGARERHRASEGSSVPYTCEDGAEAVDTVKEYMYIRCPLTSALLRTPVRSVHCEHIQCVELSAVLCQCARSNVWNCPLCSASMRPDEIRVNHRLQQWIQSTAKVKLSAIDYVIVDGSKPYVPHYATSSNTAALSVEIVD